VERYVSGKFRISSTKPRQWSQRIMLNLSGFGRIATSDQNAGNWLGLEARAVVTMGADAVAQGEEWSAGH
jgi:hypothetical protein